MADNQQNPDLPDLNLDSPEINLPPPVLEIKEEKLAETPVTVAKLRHEYYRDNQNRLMLLNMMLIGCVFAVIFLMFVIYWSRPTPTFFASTAENRLIQLEPLSEPNLTANALLSWAMIAATSAYTMNFVNYEEVLEDIKPSFTPEGYAAFTQAITESGLLQDLVNNKLVLTSVPTAPPVILKEGMAGNVYAWRVQMPMQLSFDVGKDRRASTVLVTMTITRVNPELSPKGIGISQFVVESGK